MFAYVMDFRGNGFAISRIRVSGCGTTGHYGIGSSGLGGLWFKVQGLGFVASDCKFGCEVLGLENASATPLILQRPTALKCHNFSKSDQPYKPSNTLML